MLAALLAVVTALPAASATAMPSPEPLRIIVTVHSTPFCSAFATHVNAAINAAIGNDATLGSLVATLRAKNLEGNSLERNAEIARLSLLADSVYKNYRNGEAEIGRVHELESQVTEPAEKAEIKQAADALGGAIYRQHLIQRDLDGFVSYLDAGDMRRPDDGQAQANMGLFGEADAHQAALDFDLRTRPGTGGPPFTSPFNALAGDESPAADSRYATNAAEDFLTRMSPIMADELKAASHIDNVSQHC